MDIKQGTSATVKLVPEAPMAAPLATIYTDRREVVATPAATPSPVSTTVADAADNTAQMFSVSSVIGIAPGLTIRVADPEWGLATSVVSAVIGTDVRLVEPLPAIPSAGAVVVGLDVTVVIPSAATATLGDAFVLEVMDGNSHVHMVYAVVVYPYAGPCTARHVRDRIARGYPAEFRSDEVFHARVAEEVNELIRSYLLSAERYASSYWSPTALKPALLPALKYILSAAHNLRESGANLPDYIEREERELKAAMGRVIRSAHTIDVNRDGIRTDDEKRRTYTVRLVQ